MLLQGGSSLREKRKSGVVFKGLWGHHCRSVGHSQAKYTFSLDPCNLHFCRLAYPPKTNFIYRGPSVRYGSVFGSEESTIYVTTHKNLKSITVKIMSAVLCSFSTRRVTQILEGVHVGRVPKKLNNPGLQCTSFEGLKAHL